MAYITLNKRKLQENYNHLNKVFRQENIEWAVVAKLLCGNPLFLKQVLDLGISEVCDSRISNLKTIKSIRPDVQTVYIKPPAKGNVKQVLKYADVTFNTEFDTIQMLSKAAEEMGIKHKIVIMIELGELREGVMRDEFMDFYSKVFKLPNIEVTGIGTNLTCMYGVLPNQDKLIQLCLYKQLVEAKFNKKIPYISGGASVTIPLIEKGLLPTGINHFRIGETLFLGTDVYNNRPFEAMHNDVFKLKAEIIELNEKPLLPSGELGYNLNGEKKDFDDALMGEVSFRAIVDVGLLDVESAHLTPADDACSIVGASSDMLVIDLKDNSKNLKVGDFIEFKMDYMGILRLMNSNYIEKHLEDDHSKTKKQSLKFQQMLN